MFQVHGPADFASPHAAKEPLLPSFSLDPSITLIAAMSSLEAKIVVLGAQGVGKTSLVMRYCKGAFNPAQTTSTVGASFLTKRVVDNDTDTVVRLQIWDTGSLRLLIA